MKPEPNATCDPCGAPVIEAHAGAGATLLLHPNPSPRGKVIAWQLADGSWQAALVTPAMPADMLTAHDRFSLHASRCPGRGGQNVALARAQAADAAAKRNGRGRYVPQHALSRAGAAGYRRGAP